VTLLLVVVRRLERIGGLIEVPT